MRIFQFICLIPALLCTAGAMAESAPETPAPSSSSTETAEVTTARDKENSWANRGLTAASTATTGLGTMAAASAIAAQRSDAEAEKEMRAYIETMKCDYGGGQNIKLGNEETTLPGGNELLEYYTEYKSLADELKQTKTALGLRPGIESETLYDRAQTGLYQYANAGKTGGGETSLYRALTDSESTDAAAWTEQKEETSKQLKTGAIVAGTGIVGGIVGNHLINERGKTDTDTNLNAAEIAAGAGNVLGKKDADNTKPTNETNVPVKTEVLATENPAKAENVESKPSEKPRDTSKETTIATSDIKDAVSVVVPTKETVPNTDNKEKNTVVETGGNSQNQTDSMVAQWKDNFRKQYSGYAITDDNAAKQFDFIEGDENTDEYKRITNECDEFKKQGKRYDWHGIPGAKHKIGNVTININRYLCDGYH